ncbi:hypothetical protein ACE38W_14865 [Chitinophaga sp. Hz27]|uniref:hypothetical protein n=1 Tax=Chitinophaga sp. Hz27 TaxID=3347169 RepID=UPI0035DC8C91
MDGELSFWKALFIILFIMVAMLIPVLMQRQRRKDQDRLIGEAKAKYSECLKGTDKAAALATGRDYYAMLRGGKLSVYDEQAIANDLSTMK